MADGNSGLFSCGEEVLVSGETTTMNSRYAVAQEHAPRELERLREAIDKVDGALVRLLNQRAKYAIEIGHLKGSMQLPVHSPEREKQVLTNVEEWSEGPLDSVAMRRLFERILDESRRVEGEATRSE